MIERHSYELCLVLPALRRELAVQNPCLTDVASDDEKVRNYANDRGYRSLHGIIDLLAGFFTFLLLRELDVHRVAALIGATIFQLGPYFTSQTDARPPQISRIPSMRFDFLLEEPLHPGCVFGRTAVFQRPPDLRCDDSGSGFAFRH